MICLPVNNTSQTMRTTGDGDDEQRRGKCFCRDPRFLSRMFSNIAPVISNNFQIKEFLKENILF
jgi:hypothetical protein